MDINLETLSLEELKKLQKDVTAAIENYEARRLEQARAVLEEKARELGVSIDEVFSGKAQKKKAKPKYRHPENASLTWSGRGRQPKWFVELKANGVTDEDMLIL